MRLIRLHENLDDKDVFETADCTYCDTMDKIGVPGFHEAHAAARQEATKVAPWATEPYKEKFKAVMLQHGWQFVQLPHHAESYKWEYIG